MADSFMKKLRKRLPLKAQLAYGKLKSYVKAHQLWDDEEFKRYSRWLEETEWWPLAKLEAYQLEKLQALVKHAYDNVPYYRRVFDGLKLTPADIVTLDDLQKLPILTKQDVRNNLDDLIARNADRSRMVMRATSGSSGTPLALYQNEHNSWVHETALHYRQWKAAGYKFRDPYVTIRGDVLSRPNAKGEKTWWACFPSYNQLFLSSYDMNEENLPKYIKMMREFKPQFIQAYPSCIEVFCRYVKANSIEIPGIKAVFCASEAVFPSLRQLVESALGCKIYSSYGLTEQTIFAWECEQHQGYHIGMEYGILELVDKNNEPIRKANVPGRVVGTGFDNFEMPLIRYATEDVAEYASQPCACGRQSILIKDFEGRLGEMIVSKSGYLVPHAAHHIFPVEAMLKIREMVYVQEQPGELLVKIVKLSDFSEAEVTQGFLKDIYTRLDPKEFNIQVVFVDQIPRSARGKLTRIEQKIPITNDFLDGSWNCFETEPHRSSEKA